MRTLSKAYLRKVKQELLNDDIAVNDINVTIFLVDSLSYIFKDIFNNYTIEEMGNFKTETRNYIFGIFYKDENFFPKKSVLVEIFDNINFEINDETIKDITLLRDRRNTKAHTFSQVRSRNAYYNIFKLVDMLTIL